MSRFHSTRSPRYQVARRRFTAAPLLEKEPQLTYVSFHFPVEAYLDYGYEIEKNLERNLAQRFHKDVVSVSGSGAGLGDAAGFAGADISVSIDNAAELDDPKSMRRLINEVVRVGKHSILRTVRSLRAKDITVQVIDDLNDPNADFYEWK